MEPLRTSAPTPSPFFEGGRGPDRNVGAPPAEPPKALVVSALVILAVLGLAWAGVRHHERDAAAATKQDESVSLSDAIRSVELEDEAGNDDAPSAATRAVKAPPAGPALPVGFPADLPTPADAKLVSATAADADGATRWEAVWTSPATPADARTAASAALVRAGWSITADDAVADGATLAFARGSGASASSGWFSFGPDGDGSTVGLTLTAPKN